MSTANAGTVNLSLTYDVVADGGDTTPGSPTRTLSKVLDPSDSAEIRGQTSFTLTSGDVTAVSESIRFTLLRDADGGVNDTHTGDFRVEGITIRYVGKTGPSGFSGISGSSGTSGYSGFSGISGFSGAPSSGITETAIEAFFDSSGVAAPTNVKVGRIDTLSFNPSTDNAIDFSFEVPDSLDTASNIEVVLTYHMSTANSGTVRLSLEYDVVADGGDTTPAGATDTLLKTLDPSDSAEIREQTSFTLTGGDVTAISESIRFTLLRDADSGSDTHTGEFRIEAVTVRYTGLVGTSGFSGTSGTSGFSGLSGLSGFSGQAARGLHEVQIDSTFEASGFSGPTSIKVGRIDVLSFDAAFDEAVDFSWELPRNIDTADDVTVELAYHMSTSDSGDVALELRYEVVGDGGDTTPAALTGTLTSTVTVPSTAEIRDLTTFTIPATDISSTDEAIRVTLLRDADNGADTHTGEFRLEGIVFRYTGLLGLSGTSGASGTSGFSASNRFVTVENAAKTLNATSDVGRAFTNEGATGEVLYTLPSAVSGLNYEFYCFGFTGFSGLKVRGASGNFIRLGQTQTVSSGFVLSTETGANMRLLALNASQWFGGGIVGTWDVENS